MVWRGFRSGNKACLSSIAIKLHDRKLVLRHLSVASRNWNQRCITLQVHMLLHSLGGLAEVG